MPEPREDETREEWLDRCMGDSESVEDFPDEDQRFAFCLSEWEDRNKDMPDKNQIEHKFYNFESKSVDVEKSEFTGFSAGIGNEDLGGDIIEPGAFRKTIDEKVSAGKVKLLDNHNGRSTKNVWGTLVEAKEIPADADSPSSHKLFSRFAVSESDPDAQVALNKIKEGHLDQLSIGFEPIKVEFEKEEDSDFDDPRTAWIMGQGVRRIKEVKLWEVSLVIWAMNPEATILNNSLKSLKSFAQKVRQKNVPVSEQSVKEAILALNQIIDQEAKSPDVQSAVTKALEDVSDAVDNVCSVAQKGRLDPVRYMMNEFEKNNDASILVDGTTSNEFKEWIDAAVTDTVENEEVEEKEEETETEEKDCGCGGSEEEEVEDTEEEKNVDEEVNNDVDEEVETEEKDEGQTEEDEKSDSNEDVVSAVRELKETIAELSEAITGAEDTSDSEPENLDAEDQEEEEKTDSHTEEDEVDEQKEAAQDADEDGRSKHFPGQDELAAELELLRISKIKN